MMEDQGRSLLTGALKKLLGWMLNTYKQAFYKVEDKVKSNITETGKQSVKALVNKGRDLKLSEVIQNDEHLKKICAECKAQGIAFAIKKEENGEKRLLFQRKDSDLVENAICSVLSKAVDEKADKSKRSLAETLSRNKELSNKEHGRNAPLVHREVGAR